jgi:hypothetical protein
LGAVGLRSGGEALEIETPPLLEEKRLAISHNASLHPALM